jgi:hypothetical protein
VIQPPPAPVPGIERASTAPAPGAAAGASTKREISLGAHVGDEELLRFPVRTQTTQLRSGFPGAVFRGQAQAELMSLRPGGAICVERHRGRSAPTAGAQS